MEYGMRIFKYDDDWICEFPDLPGCTGVGNSPEEAVEDGKIAKELWLEAFFEEKGFYPSVSDLASKEYSGKWVQRVPRSLHRDLVLRAEQEGVSLNTLCSTLLASGLEKGKSAPQITLNTKWAAPTAKGHGLFKKFIQTELTQTA